MNQRKRPTIRFDWRAYYERFKQTHGEPPDYVGVRYADDDVGDCVLFPDGWRWGLTRSGPEYPPPSDAVALAQLRVYYYRARRVALVAARDRLRDVVDGVRVVKQQYSLPLIERVRYIETTEDGETQRRSESQELDDFILEHRLEQADRYLNECEQKLNEAAEHLRQLHSTKETDNGKRPAVSQGE